MAERELQQPNLAPEPNPINPGDLSHDIANSKKRNVGRMGGVAGTVAAMTLAGSSIGLAQEPSPTPTQEPVEGAKPTEMLVFNPDINGDSVVTFGEFVAYIPKFAVDFANYVQQEIEENQESVVTPTAKPSEEPEIDLGKYSLESFLALKDKSLTEESYIEIMEDVAPSVSEYLITHGLVKFTPEKVFKADMTNLKSLKRSWSMEWAGFSIANMVVGALEKAEIAAKEGNTEIADAFLTKAEAYVRIGKTKIDFEKSPMELDREIKRVAKEFS